MQRDIIEKEMFKEVDILGALDNPHIVKLHGFTKKPGKDFNYLNACCDFYLLLFLERTGKSLRGRFIIFQQLNIFAKKSSLLVYLYLFFMSFKASGSNIYVIYKDMVLYSLEFYFKQM